MQYSEAILRRGDAQEGYQTLWDEGPQIDDYLKGLLVVGDYQNGHDILANEPRDDELLFSNARSVTPWWFDKPWDFNPLGLLRMLSIIRYPHAMQTLDGGRHKPVRDAYMEGQKLVTSGATNLTETLIDRTLDQMEVHFDRTDEPYDLKQAIQAIRLKVLALELGLPTPMMQRLPKVTASQMRFLWGVPAPTMREHPRLAKEVGDSYRGCKKLVQASITSIEGGKSPSTVTDMLAKAAIEKTITREEAIATVFGAYNAGEGTLTGTAVNVFHHLLSQNGADSPAWTDLEGLSTIDVRSIVRESITGNAAVRAWQKEAAEDLELARPNGQAMQVRRGTRMLVVTDAMDRDPARPDNNSGTSAFSEGAHRCPGELISHRTMGALVVKAAKRFPGLQLVEESRPVQRTLVFASHDRLLVGNS